MRHGQVIARGGGAALLAVLVTTGAPAPPPQRRSPIVESLDRYASGDARAVERLVGNQSDLTGFVQKFTKETEGWLRSAASRDTAGRMRTAAAAFALEAAFTPTVRRTPQEPAARRSLLTWAMSLLGQTEATAAERAWYRAAVALGEREIDPHLLIGSTAAERAAAARAGADALKQLEASVQSSILGHALRRFPGDPHFALAEVRAIERETWWLSRTSGSGSSNTPRDDELRGPELARLRREGEAALELLQTVRTPQRLAEVQAANLVRLDHLAVVESGYARFATVEPVRPEALLRLGYHELRVGKIASAQSRFAEVLQVTPDPFLRYFSSYFTAWTLERAGRRDAAEQPYRDALAAMPGAGDPVRIRLAALLMLSDRRSEASQLINATLPNRSWRDPTWELFKRGDVRMLPDLLARLREAIR